MKVNLPTEVNGSDYHDFSSLQEEGRKIISGLKISEVGFDGDNYVAIAYVGNLKSPKNAEFLKQLKDRINKHDEERWG